MTDKALETSYRVFYMAPNLVEQWRKVRDKDETITRDWVAAVVADKLPTIKKELAAMGLVAPDERVAVRLELPLGTLQDLSDVAEESGIPATQLLSMCLDRGSRAKAKRGRPRKSS